MLQDNTSDPRELLWGEPVVSGEGDRIEPELAGGPLVPNMDVDRLVTIKAVEEEPERSGNTLDCGPMARLACPGTGSWRIKDKWVCEIE